VGYYVAENSEKEKKTTKKGKKKSRKRRGWSQGGMNREGGECKTKPPYSIGPDYGNGRESR